MKNPINVTSEIGELQTVLLHQPGEELENLTTEFLDRLLFDTFHFCRLFRRNMIISHLFCETGGLKFCI